MSSRNCLTKLTEGRVSSPVDECIYWQIILYHMWYEGEQGTEAMKSNHEMQTKGGTRGV